MPDAGSTPAMRGTRTDLGIGTFSIGVRPSSDFPEQDIAVGAEGAPARPAAERRPDGQRREIRRRADGGPAALDLARRRARARRHRRALITGHLAIAPARPRPIAASKRFVGPAGSPRDSAGVVLLGEIDELVAARRQVGEADVAAHPLAGLEGVGRCVPEDELIVHARAAAEDHGLRRTRRKQHAGARPIRPMLLVRHGRSASIPWAASAPRTAR